MDIWAQLGSPFSACLNANVSRSISPEISSVVGLRSGISLSICASVLALKKHTVNTLQIEARSFSGFSQRRPTDRPLGRQASGAQSKLKVCGASRPGGGPRTARQSSCLEPSLTDGCGADRSMPVCCDGIRGTRQKSPGWSSLLPAFNTPRVTAEWLLTDQLR